MATIVRLAITWGAGRMKQFNSKKSWLAEHWFLIVLVVLALGVGAYMVNFYATHEKVPDDPSFNLTPDVSNNRFFASQKFLQANGKTVHVSQGNFAHIELKKVWQQSTNDAKKHAVMLLSISKSQEPDIDNMLHWVEKGGHLITFSQHTIRMQESDDDEEKAKALENYRFNQNPLLVKLGIISQVFDKYDEKFRQPDTENTDNSESEQISKSKLPTVDMDDIVFLRLPNPHEPNQSGTLAILNTNTDTRLQGQDFFRQYPTAKKVADYTFVQNFDVDNPLVTENIQFSPVNNALTEKQYTILKESIQQRPENYMPPDNALFDVYLGEGRITVLNNNRVFSNPDNDILESRYEQYCTKVQFEKIEFCQQAKEMNKKQLDMASMPVPTTWELLDTNPYSYYYSYNIAQHDNALILNYLVQQREHVWLIPDIEVFSLPTLLWRYMQWACLAFVVFLLMGLLALPKRFGLVRPYQTDSQQNIFGYFDHVGQYLWQNDQALALVTQNRQRLLEKIIARHAILSNQTPVGESSDPNLVCQIVADELNMSRNAVAEALYDEWQNEREFLQISRQFAKINRHY